MCVPFWGLSMPERPHDKLDHYLDAFVLTPDRRKIIRNRVYQSGHSPDDPIAILTAQDGIMEGRLVTVLAGLKGLPAQIEKSGSSLSAEIVSHVTKKIDQRHAALLADLRKQVGEDVDLAIKSAVSKADIRYFRRAALQVALVCLLSAGIAGIAGYVQGRQDTRNLEGGYAEIVGRPDADTWLGIISNNQDIDGVLKTECQRDSGNILQLEDRLGCSVPLWIDNRPDTRPDFIATYFNAAIRWVLSGTPVWILLLCSLGFGFYAGFASKLATRFIMEKDVQ